MVVGLAHFGGFNVGQPIGAFVALGSILLAILGVRIARRTGDAASRAAIAPA